MVDARRIFDAMTPSPSPSSHTQTHIRHRRDLVVHEGHARNVRQLLLRSFVLGPYLDRHSLVNENLLNWHFLSSLKTLYGSDHVLRPGAVLDSTRFAASKIEYMLTAANHPRR